MTWLAGPRVARCLGEWVGFGADDGDLCGYGRVLSVVLVSKWHRIHSVREHFSTLRARVDTMLYTGSRLYFPPLYITDHDSYGTRIGFQH